ncbi:conjugative transfer signal peptidase TraF [Neorhizobium huautlense]|uniref:Conjugative transfer signal peptidase TraF n=1 Tax=Neorhizobium huautlense TaxID=67774 RepID=A0ABT9PVQ3_9HYPH|nr:conjugative transfer signal peptidase TraF [Neorhizobium huautlense]MDP9838585.1 conjugative transfer signal peptidase TraF [Neorhizobium huautlense]
MINQAHDVLSTARQTRPGLVLLCASGLFTLAAVVAGFAGGLRLNTTPSEPLGLWRIVRLDRPVERGDILFICPPISADMQEARSRGYLRFGLCEGGNAPLIKTVAALPDQVVEIGEVVRIDGEVLAHSRLSSTDGKRRRLNPYAGGKVGADQVYLHSDFPGSFDSRYFGPLPINNILGLAKELITYAP